MAGDEEFESYDVSDGYNATDFGIEEEHRLRSGLDPDPIDFELEDAKRRTAELKRKNVLIEPEIQEMEFRAKRLQLEEARQKYRTWGEWIQQLFD